MSICFKYLKSLLIGGFFITHLGELVYPSDLGSEFLKVRVLQWVHALVAQQAEATDLKSVKCPFESDSEHCDLSSMGRTLECGSSGYGFESRRSPMESM